MIKYVLKLLQLIPVLIGVVTVVFILNQMMPGDPARLLAGETATEEAVQEVRKELGLDKPVIVQYFDYVGGIATRMDLGTSTSRKLLSPRVFVGGYPQQLRLRH